MSLLAACAGDSSADSDGMGQPLPEVTLQTLQNECDYIDIIFYNSPMSMSQDEQRAIRATVSYISPESATPGASCKPIARMAFMKDGAIVADANVYCTEGCTYLEWIENEKPRYYNTLSRTGVQFFSGILSQIPKPQ